MSREHTGLTQSLIWRISERKDLSRAKLKNYKRYWSSQQPLVILIPRNLGMEDSRSTLTLPVWLSIFPEARVIHIVRNGIDVGMSLQRREPRRLFSRRDAEPMIPPLFTRGYRLWSEYLQPDFSANFVSPIICWYAMKILSKRLDYRSTSFASFWTLIPLKKYFQRLSAKR